MDEQEKQKNQKNIGQQVPILPVLFAVLLAVFIVFAFGLPSSPFAEKPAIQTFYYLDSQDMLRGVGRLEYSADGSWHVEEGVLDFPPAPETECSETLPAYFIYFDTVRVDVDNGMVVFSSDYYVRNGFFTRLIKPLIWTENCRMSFEFEG